MGTMYGYARVSTCDQNLDRQLDALSAFGVADGDVFADKASGKDFDRPEYCRLAARLEPGDTLVVTGIDRLGRNYDDILEQWRLLTRERGVAVVVLDMPLLDTRAAHRDVTSEFVADLVLQLLSYVAQVERENIRQRQAEGIAAAKRRGVRFGRPLKERPEAYGATRERYLAGAISRATAASELGVCVNTFVRWLREDEA
jgi:DNA invertase Pin-like site-specific DNA recombinase